MVVLEKKAGWLFGWKAIAEYCDCSIQTVKKMSKKKLPIRRAPDGGIFALPSELDQWLKECELLKI